MSKEEGKSYSCASLTSSCHRLKKKEGKKERRRQSSLIKGEEKKKANIALPRNCDSLYLESGKGGKESPCSSPFMGRRRGKRATKEEDAQCQKEVCRSDRGRCPGVQEKKGKGGGARVLRGKKKGSPRRYYVLGHSRKQVHLSQQKKKGLTWAPTS